MGYAKESSGGAGSQCTRGGVASKKAMAENEHKASLQADPDQGTVSAVYEKLLVDDKKYPERLFEYAPAAQYGAPRPVVAPDDQAKLLDYFNKAHKDFTDRQTEQIRFSHRRRRAHCLPRI